MGSEWPQVQFGSLYREPSRNGLTKPKRVRGKGIKFINMGEIFAHDRLLGVPADRAPLTEKELVSSLLEPNDLLFARQSLVLSGAGKCSIFLGDDQPVSFESHLIRVRLDSDKVIPKYYYYYFRSPEGKAAIYSIVEQGAGASGIRGSDLINLNVIRPPLVTQRAIAHILGSLDDKIELNRQMNRTLEKMAQAIFKSWFIDFDPVRAKADGHNPGLPKEIADLFPDSFKDSELGPIPKGWKVKALDKIAEYFNGLACQKYPAVSGESSLPVIKIRELRQGISSKTDRATPNVPEKFLVSNGDVLFSWSGSLLVDVWTGGPGVLNQHVFKVTSNAFPKWFYFLWTTHHLKEFQKIAADKATTMGHIKRHHLSDAKVVVPPQAIMDAANGQMKPLFESQLDNSRQALQLERTRDTLLPKLISGNLHIPDAEKLVEDLNRNGDSNGKS